MDARLDAVTEAGAGEIVVTRVLDAPRELVFAAWTDEERLKRWWAPKGCTTQFCTVDLRPGGKFHYCMRMSDGKDVWGIGIYREIVALERIVYIDSFADAEGNPVPPTHYGLSADHPAETLLTVTFAERAGKTTLTLRHALPATVTERDATEQGWIEMLDRLAQDLAKARDGGPRWTQR
ncbi:MAG: SRPBCC domain-containing protein [Bauldia sp.]